MSIPRGFRVFIGKHPSDDLPFIQGTDPDPREKGFLRFRWEGDAEDYSGWYVRESTTRGFTRCDECGGEGDNGGGLPEIGEPDPCPSCSGSGLLPTEKLREEARRALFAVGDKPNPGDFHEWLDRLADAVLRKVAEHIGDDR